MSTTVEPTAGSSATEPVTPSTGEPGTTTSSTTVGNGHVWLCDEYGSKCRDYVPMDGDKDACSCLLPQ
ncbi:hypothetical protein [Nannocystis pusilla]|uniref:Uncharacterized protein n=1 Tax=Nannocystis pusilla TaxID=889268 RepID=A0ABS7TUW3_9BACT|nr:hypothetical protein [Nannocystis pusilla]MBZ5711979.1 hypothetical protein [Nannocystis pusilla]